MERTMGNIIEKLMAIHDHDWRVSHLANTSDTAKEAADCISDLLEAAKKVLAGLNARIDNAPLHAVPVFDGIAELHAAIHKAEST